MLIQADGMPQKVTIPPTKWDEDHASYSEAIVKAEKYDSPSIQDMQAKTVNMIKNKEVDHKGAQQARM